MNKYYQAKSEIDDKTSVNPSYGVYHSKEICQNRFPNSEIMDLDYRTVEGPVFIDSSEITVNDKKILEALQYIVKENSYVSWEDLDDNDATYFNSEFAFCIFENSEQLPGLLDFKAKMDYVGAEKQYGNLEDVYFKALSLLEKGKTITFHFGD